MTDYVAGQTLSEPVTVTPADGTTTVAATLTDHSSNTISHPTPVGAVVSGTWSGVVPVALATPGLWTLRIDVTGTGADVQFKSYGVEAVPPPALGRRYATSADFAAWWPGRPVPAGIDALLRLCTIDIDATLIASRYDITDPAVVDTLTEACVTWAAELDSAFPNAAGLAVGGSWASVAIGTVKLERGSAQSGMQTFTVGAGVPINSRAWTVLQLAGLTGHAVGAAGSWWPIP